MSAGHPIGIREKPRIFPKLARAMSKAFNEDTCKKIGKLAAHPDKVKHPPKNSIIHERRVGPARIGRLA
jgi:hypothetical protein